MRWDSGVRGVVEEVWQEGLEELVQWNAGLRGVVEEVWQEGLEELVGGNAGLRGGGEEGWQVGEEGGGRWGGGSPCDDARRRRNKWRAGQAHA